MSLQIASLIELQHINIKLLLKDAAGLDLEPIIPIFHSWIQGQVFEGELLIDVADYRHVPDGPGVMLIGHESDYSLDNTDGRLGVRYSRKAVLEGSNQDRLRQALRATLKACERLESDPRLNGKVQFDGQNIQIELNDRLLAPNTPETRQAAEPELREFAQELLGDYEISFEANRRRLFAAHLKARHGIATRQLLEALGG
jgi:hypothetical protein